LRKATSRHILAQDLVEIHIEEDIQRLDGNISFLLNKNQEHRAKMELNNSIRVPFNIENIAEDEDGTSEIEDEKYTNQ
jgi:hypothetical protein